MPLWDFDSTNEENAVEEIEEKYEKSDLQILGLKREIRVINNTNVVNGSFSGSLVMFHQTGRLQG